jgi:ketosteroid isomerase-like protein
VDFSSGERFKNSKAELMKRWTSFRDSLSSVTIDMQGWKKMYSTDKKDGYIIAWYKEIDTFKDGKADSADYHDINQVKDGKIVWYSQYKRPRK